MRSRLCPLHGNLTRYAPKMLCIPMCCVATSPQSMNQVHLLAINYKIRLLAMDTIPGSCTQRIYEGIFVLKSFLSSYRCRQWNTVAVFSTEHTLLTKNYPAIYTSHNHPTTLCRRNKRIAPISIVQHHRLCVIAQLCHVILVLEILLFTTSV